MSRRVTPRRAAGVAAAAARPADDRVVLGVPCLLELLLQQLFGRNSPVFQHIGTPLLGLFPFSPCS